MHLTESELIEQWALGDRAAAETLIRKYYPHAYAICLGFCAGDQELTNTAVQSFFTRLSQTLPAMYEQDRVKFDFVKDNFQAYLLKGLRNNAQEQLRSRSRRNNRVAPMSSVPNGTAIPNRQTDSFERKNTLEYVLSFLPESQKEIYKCYLEGYSYEEIAEQTGLTKNQVRGRIERSNKSLKEHRSLIRQLLTQ